MHQLSEIINEPWLIAGDFNVLLSSTDMKGGASKRNKGFPLFDQFISHNSLSQVDNVEPNFTLKRGTLFQCLDTAIVNSS